MSSSQTVIDGAKTPQSIPDSVAYRLFFDANTQPDQPTAAQVQRQRAKLARTGLSQPDRDALNAEISKFHAAYTTLAGQYKQAVAAAINTGAPLDRAGFVAKRESLIQSTRNNLKAELTADGAARLDAFIQQEKARMKIVTSAAMP